MYYLEKERRVVLGWVVGMRANGRRHEGSRDLPATEERCVVCGQGWDWEGGLDLREEGLWRDGTRVGSRYRS